MNTTRACRRLGVAFTAGLAVWVAVAPAAANEIDHDAILKQFDDVVDLLDPDFQNKPINAAKLPKAIAIKTVHGNGRRVIYTFEDPNCSYCREMTRHLAGIGDITVYTFVFPILGDDSRHKADLIWCAPDRTRAWQEVMSGRSQRPSAAPRPNCAAPSKLVMEIAERLGIRLTPTSFFADGSRMVGVKPPETILARLNAAAARP